MARFLLLTLCCLTVVQAQGLPNMTDVTPQQRVVINRNALAFTGHTCIQYGASLNRAPAGITEAQQRWALSQATEYMLSKYRSMGITPTRVQRTPDEGAAVYFANDPSFMQVTWIQTGTQVDMGTFACMLK